jgi:hypothetical protein
MIYYRGCRGWNPGKANIGVRSDMTPPENIVLCFCGDPNCVIPYGTCHCGCKERTRVSEGNDKSRNAVKGRPLLYVFRHKRITGRTVEDAAPFKIDGAYCRLVPLTKGMYAIVDAADYEWLMQWKWRAQWDRRRNCYIVLRWSKAVEGNRRRVFMYREILGLDPDDPHQGDHENVNTLDNRRKNLRKSTVSQNCMNRRKRSDNTSGFKGVSFHRRLGKWQAAIAVNGKDIYLGYFSDRLSAHNAYCEAAKIYHGEFART